jgi:fructose/tagatose bisphosphate aldolase
MHSDHCAKKLLPWFDGMVKADEAYFATHGVPLFSSHMLDLSEESQAENIETCVHYLKRMSKINCFLEMELGITGGEEVPIPIRLIIVFLQPSPCSCSVVSRCSALATYCAHCNPPYLPRTVWTTPT